MGNGKNKLPQNIWDENHIPALEYCKLDRAAELLGCKVDDLLHWAETGAIELCLLFSNFRAVINHPLSKFDNAEEWIAELEPDPSDIFHLSEYSSFYFDAKEVRERASGNLSIAYKFECLGGSDSSNISVFISGLWGLCAYPQATFYRDIKEHNQHDFYDVDLMLKVADDTVPLTESIVAYAHTAHLYENGYRTTKPQILFSVKKEDLFITRVQVEKIHFFKGKRAPSFISGEVEIPQINQGEMADKKTRTTVRQADYIVGLLRALNITDDELAGSIPNLRKSIARKAPKIALPDVDDNTLVDWLRRAGIKR